MNVINLFDQVTELPKRCPLHLRKPFLHPGEWINPRYDVFFLLEPQNRAIFAGRMMYSISPN